VEASAVRVGAYRVAVLLPDAQGRPVSPGPGGQVSREHVNRAFLAVAWPEDPRAGHRAYAVNHTLLVAERVNEDGSLAGAEPPIAALPALVVLDAAAERPVVVSTLPAPWTIPMGRAQKRWMRNRLAEMGVPVPAGLAAEPEPKPKQAGR
jgi:hypothetical protein